MCRQDGRPERGAGGRDGVGGEAAVRRAVAGGGGAGGGGAQGLALYLRAREKAAACHGLHTASPGEGGSAQGVQPGKGLRAVVLG